MFADLDDKSLVKMGRKIAKDCADKLNEFDDEAKVIKLLNWLNNFEFGEVDISHFEPGKKLRLRVDSKISCSFFKGFFDEGFKQIFGTEVNEIKCKKKGDRHCVFHIV